MSYCDISRLQVEKLTNEELKLLWFHLDKYLDSIVLESVYVEMCMRGISRFNHD